MFDGNMNVQFLRSHIFKDIYIYNSIFGFKFMYLNA